MLFMGENPNALRDSLKMLEADVMHANTLLAGELTRDYDGAFLQMRISYSPLSSLLLLFLHWSDCHLAGALGVMRILIYKVFKNGNSTLAMHERKASIRDFYSFLLPALQQLQPGLTAAEFRQQKKASSKRYRKVQAEDKVQQNVRLRDAYRVVTAGEKGQLGEKVQIEERLGEEEWRRTAEGDVWQQEGMWLLGGGECGVREEEGGGEKECGICLEEQRQQVVLPGCLHQMCERCFSDWRQRDESCPFCRDDLREVEEEDLWVMVDEEEAIDMRRVVRDNLRRFFFFIQHLPVVFSDGLFSLYDAF